MPKIESEYSAALTGGGFLFRETDVLLPLLMSEQRADLIKDEAINNRLLMINAEKSRQRNISEIERRFDKMPSSFWADYIQMPETDRMAANLFVILSTYKVAYEFHVNVTIKKWNSINQTIEKRDILRYLGELSDKDEFVASWADTTKGKVASAYLTILRKAGMLDSKGKLKQICPSNPDYYLNIGEAWFLDACLWAPYQITKLKKGGLK